MYLVVGERPPHAVKLRGCGSRGQIPILVTSISLSVSRNLQGPEDTMYHISCIDHRLLYRGMFPCLVYRSTWGIFYLTSLLLVSITWLKPLYGVVTGLLPPLASHRTTLCRIMRWRYATGLSKATQGLVSVCFGTIRRKSRIP